MSESYTDFATVYDKFMDNVPYEEWAETIIDVMNRLGVSKLAAKKATDGEISVDEKASMEDTDAFAEALSEKASEEVSEEILDSERNLVLDLGCGTGTLTELLASRGYDMIGVDNSMSMLEIAMQKRAQNKSGVLYLLQDMRELDLYSTVGTVISVCDSVNYILEEDELLEVFRSVNNYLFPGGLFIFDFNTDYKYREVIGDATIAESREDCSFIWDNYYDKESGLNEYDLTIFVQEDGDLFRRFSEGHVQRGYTVEQMKRLVEQAGLKVIEIKDSDTGEAVTDTSERVFVVAKEVIK